MKKVILALCLTAGFSFGTLAQVKFAAGLKSGLNFSDLQNIAGDFNSRTSWHAGAFTRFKFTKLALQPEVYYSRQGSDFFGDFFEVDYLNIPILTKVYLLKGLNVFAGPQVGIAVSSSEAFLTDNDNNDVGNINIFKTADLSAVFGVGIDLPFDLLIDVRYNLGLNNVNNLDDLGDTTEIRNRVFQISVGYILFGK